MKKLKKYSKELSDKKNKIIEIYGQEITQALFNEFACDEHKLEVKDDDYRHFYSDEYSEVSKSLDSCFGPCENIDLDNYIEELTVCDRND